MEGCKEGCLSEAIFDQPPAMRDLCSHYTQEGWAVSIPNSLSQFEVTVYYKISMILRRCQRECAAENLVLDVKTT